MTTRDAQREATKRTVLEVAEGLFLERGFDATTVRDIAETAGVSVGTVMAVGDKRALLAAVFERGMALVDERRMRDAVRASRRGREGSRMHPMRPADRILDIVVPYAELFASRSELAREYGAVLMTGRYGQHTFRGRTDELREAIERELCEPPGPAHPDPHGAAHAISLAFMGALFAWAGSHERDAREFLADVRSATEAIVDRRAQTPRPGSAAR